MRLRSARSCAMADFLLSATAFVVLMVAPRPGARRARSGRADRMMCPQLLGSRARWACAVRRRLGRRRCSTSALTLALQARSRTLDRVSQFMMRQGRASRGRGRMQPER